MRRARRRKRRRRKKKENVISNEIWGAVVDHVLNRGLSMREASQRVQPNISRFSVASILWTFRSGNR